MISCKHLYNSNDKLLKGLWRNICADYIPITITITTTAIAIEISNWKDDTLENKRTHKNKANERGRGGESVASRSGVFVVDTYKYMPSCYASWMIPNTTHTHIKLLEYDTNEWFWWWSRRSNSRHTHGSNIWFACTRTHIIHRCIQFANLHQYMIVCKCVRCVWIRI